MPSGDHKRYSTGELVLLILFLLTMLAAGVTLGMTSDPSPEFTFCSTVFYILVSLFLLLGGIRHYFFSK